MDQLQKVFEYQGASVRTIVVDGEPQFVARDACDILELGDVSRAVSRLDDDEKGTISIRTPGGEQMMLVVTEAGLYALILGSRKPEAKLFKRWVRHEVLPSVRKHGAYMTPAALEQALQDPDTMIRILTSLKDEQEKRRLAEQIIEQQRPKVLFAEAVSASKDSILINELAKILKQNGVDTGERRMFVWLRQNGYIMQTRDRENIPTQRAMELGLFEIHKVTIQVPDRDPKVRSTTKVTPKGQQYFVNKFLRAKQVPGK